MRIQKLMVLLALFINDLCTVKLLREVPVIEMCVPTSLHCLSTCYEILACLQFQLAFLASQQTNHQMVWVNLSSKCKSSCITLTLQRRMQNDSRRRLTVARDHEYSSWGFVWGPWVFSSFYPQVSQQDESVKKLVVS